VTIWGSAGGDDYPTLNLITPKIMNGDDIFPDRCSNDFAALATECRVCGRRIGNYWAARANHARAHVRRGHAVETRDVDGFLKFVLPPLVNA
jgi:hypothetical protein